MRSLTRWIFFVAWATLSSACDQGSDAAPPAPAMAPASTPTPQPTIPPRLPPEIIVDPNQVAVGKEHVLTAADGLADRVATLIDPASIETPEERPVEVVVMRAVKPSQVAAVLVALRRAKAKEAIVKTESREGTTDKLSLSFATSVPECATVAWIAQDAAIDVWPAGGGVAKRVIRGLAGPDMTLGVEAISDRFEKCGASALVVGADEAMTWGLVFDLATSVLRTPGARASAAILVTGVTPGRRVELK
jgi:hypothetical protein